MYTRRVLLLHFLLFSAVTTYAERLPGCVCFARSSAQCSSNKDSLTGFDSPGLKPIKSPQAPPQNAVENLARINLACMKADSQLHLRQSVESSGSEVSSSTALFGKPWRVSGFLLCKCGAMQKTTIPDSEMQKVHEETLRNAQKANVSSKPVNE